MVYYYKPICLRLIMKWNENEETIKKSCSPNSIYFYLKKYNNDLEKAQIHLNEYRVKMKGKLKNPNKIDFWTDKGYSKKEAIKKISEIQSERGKGKRNISPFKTEVENFQKTKGVSYDQAYEMACKRRRGCSPRLLEYWIDKGYSEEESKKRISEFQKRASPRSLDYWLCLGHTEEEAARKVSSYQDNNSLKALMKRFNCGLDEAIDICNETRKDEEMRMLYLFYMYRVRQFTERIYKSFKDQIDPDNLRGREYHLDHIKPIIQCFDEGLSIEKAAAIDNLQIIPCSENLTKGKDRIQYGN